MHHPNHYYGIRDLTAAPDLPLNEWTDISKVDSRGIYGVDQKAFQSAYFHGETQVGKVVKGIPYRAQQDLLSPYDLVLHVRRIQDVGAIRNAERVKRDARRAKAEAAKSRQDVITLDFDKDWNLVGKTTENRTVYSSSTRKFIKTRSNGSPTVHEHKGKFYVVMGYNKAGRHVYQKVWNDSLGLLLDKHG